MNNRFKSVKKYLILHLSILVYVMSSIVSKVASQYDFLSISYILCFVAMFATLGFYAIIWQQVIKVFSPSVAYSNKAVTIIWVLIFSNILFHEGITIQNIIGTILIIVGVIMVAQNE